MPYKYIPKEKRTWTLYRHISPSGKSYIGITGVQPKKRWQNGNGYKGCRYFEFAIKKYGWESIIHEILLTDLTEDEANEKEQYYIKLFRTNDERYGYNLAEGGSAKTTSKETKELMRQNRQGKNAHGWGHKPSEEARKKVSEKIKGIKRTTQTKEKLAKSHSNKVYQYDLNGNFIQSFNSSVEAYKETGASRSHIREVCLFRGYNKTVKGYFWAEEYIDNPILIQKYLKNQIKIPPKPANMFKKVIQYDENKNILNIYSSIKKASQCTKITEQAIGYACKNQKIAGDYYWEYLPEDIYIFQNYFMYYATLSLKDE